MKILLATLILILSTLRVASASVAEDMCNAAAKAGDRIGTGVYCQAAAEDWFLSADKQSGRDKYLSVLNGGLDLTQAGMARVQVQSDNIKREGRDNLRHAVSTFTDLAALDSTAQPNDVSMRLQALALAQKWLGK
jgi:hypothetical protein